MPDSRAPVRAWSGVVMLGISAFSIVTSELAPVGILSSLARDLHQSEAATGLVVTAYGWVGALAALLSGALSPRISRKVLLAGLMLILGISCIAATYAHSMSMFMSARIAGAIAHGMFWALIGAVAAQLVPPGKLGLATAIIFGGVSAASVLGVPLVSLISGMAGWRTAFMAISLLALLAACGLIWTLPELVVSQPLSMRVYRELCKNRTLLMLYVATVGIITAHFAAFTYLEPLLTQALGVPSTWVTALLLLSGISGLAGNIVAGKLIDRHIHLLMQIALLLSAGALAMLAVRQSAAPAFWQIGLLLALWGAGIAIIFVGLQTWVLRSAGAATQPASAIYVAIFNAAIGSGALAGGQILALTSLRNMIMLAAGVMVCSALFMLRLNAPE